MIPVADIAQWRLEAPWVQDAQVEQDLVLTRALVAMFNHPVLADELAFRGGTALFKLHVRPAARYSEDIDLVQLKPGPIGPVLDALRKTLDPWLGKARQTTKEGRVVLVYRFQSEGPPVLPLRLKVEINTREHVAFLGVQTRELVLASRWAAGSAQVPTYALDELLGTKLRALYQRKKGRDFFDFVVAGRRDEVDLDRVVTCFKDYLALEDKPISRAQFEQNLRTNSRTRLSWETSNRCWPQARPGRWKRPAVGWRSSCSRGWQASPGAGCLTVIHRADTATTPGGVFPCAQRIPRFRSGISPRAAFP